MKFLRKLNWFSREEEGAATAEFVVLFPIILGLIAVNFHSAVLMLKYTELESALDKSVREVRLHGFPESDDNGLAYFKSEICSHANYIKNCASTLTLEMSPIDTSAGFVKPAGAKCIDRTQTSQPVIEFVPGRQNDAVYLRACVVVDRIGPTIFNGFGLFDSDASGGIQLIADTAYVVEPL